MFANTVRNTATTLAASVLATTVCFAIATTPVHAAESNTFRTKVERSIDNTLRLPMGNSDAVATVSVQIDADGRVASAKIAKSTGNAAYDKEALRTAQSVFYPAGKARSVAMVLGFGRPVTTAERDAAVAQVAALKNDNRHLLASETNGQPVG